MSDRPEAAGPPPEPMQILRDLGQLRRQFPYPVVTLGNYDGVHVGHQAIFRRVLAAARRNRGTAVIFTFEPHPLRVLAPERCPPLLNTLRRKMELFESLGMDVVVCAAFTRAFAATPPEEFVRRYLVQGLGTREVFVGYDYAFGRDKGGTPEALREMGRRYGFTVTVVPAVEVDGEVVSTTRIRGAVLEGRIEEVTRLLGRCYATEGTVVPGEHRGKDLGFPTANLHSHNQIHPKAGVYAVEVEYRGRRLRGVMNIGTHPTFGPGKTTLEVHIFDFHREIYGEFVRVLYRARLRDEIRFPDARALVVQIRKDVEQARAVLARPCGAGD